MSKDAYTENLGDFGLREIKELRDILDSWVNHGLPEGFADTGVKPAMNRNSGYVFLVNEDYQCAMHDGERLAMHHSLPYSGQEGFLENLLEENKPNDLNQDDIDYISNAPEFSKLIASGKFAEWEKLTIAA